MGLALLGRKRGEHGIQYGVSAGVATGDAFHANKGDPPRVSNSHRGSVSESHPHQPTGARSGLGRVP